ncbi:hypothetical protein Aperf_G00000112449 [Anoplocephala perfoliata]
MQNFIESQLGVSVSIKFLEEHKLDSNHHQQLLDITNTDQVRKDGSLPLGGNPLPLDEIVDFALVEGQLKLKGEATSSRLFNLERFKLIAPEDLSKFFSDVGEGVLLPVSGTNNSPSQLVALLPGLSPETRRILRVFTIPDTDREVKLDQLQSRYMPFCEEVNVSFEADYTLFSTHLHMEFSTPTDGLLSHPDNSTFAQLTTKVYPYLTDKSPLGPIKSDLDRIKRLFLAHLNEVSWIPLASFNSSNLEEIIARHLNSVDHQTRDLDSTERMWEALKDVSDRRSAREGFLIALRLLLEKPYLLSVDRSNFTQFAKLAQNHIISSQSGVNAFDVRGLPMLIEAGIFKVTNDCLAVINDVSSHMAWTSTNTFLRSDVSLEKRLQLLHHLYRIACLTTALGTIAQATIVEKEIGPLLTDTKSSEVDFNTFMTSEELDLEQVVSHECTTRLENLTAQLIEMGTKVVVAALLKRLLVDAATTIESGYSGRNGLDWEEELREDSERRK